MTLRVQHRGNSRKRYTLVKCPAEGCTYEWDRNELRENHLEEHDPEDFGLSPLGERDEEAMEPLFTPVEELPEPEPAPTHEEQAETYTSKLAPRAAPEHD